MIGPRSVAALAVLPLALAQTFTDCNPLKTTCPKDAGLAQSNFNSDFTSSDHSHWDSLAGTSINYGSNGAEFKIAKDGDAPTMQTDFYIFFGKVDVVMQASPGTGIVSSIVLESDDLDEIDWEFLGGDTTEVQTNFFGKGDTSSYDRGGKSPVSTPQTSFHKYTVEVTSDAVTWSIDDTQVRQVPYNSAVANNGQNFPQTPMRVKLGSWAAGGSGQPAGTVQWAGGNTDFSKGPFSMFVKSVAITNYNPAGSYSYSDNSGSYKSITKGDAVAGNASGSAAASSQASSTAASSIAQPVKGNDGGAAATGAPLRPSGAVVPSASVKKSSLVPSGTGLATSAKSSGAPNASASVVLSKGGAGTVTVSTGASLLGLAFAFFML